MRVFRIFHDFRIFQSIENPEIRRNYLYAEFSYFKQKHCRIFSMIIYFRISLTSWVSCIHDTNQFRLLRWFISHNFCVSIGAQIYKVRSTDRLQQHNGCIRLGTKASATTIPTRLWPQCHLNQHYHDDVIKWKPFLRYWPFVRGIHRSPVNSPHKGQWRGVTGWVNNREAGDLRRYRAHYNVTVIVRCIPRHNQWTNLYFTYYWGRSSPSNNALCVFFTCGVLIWRAAFHLVLFSSGPNTLIFSWIFHCCLQQKCLGIIGCY